MPIHISCCGGGGSTLPANPLSIDADTYFQLVGDTLTLYVNGQAIQTWTVTPPTPTGDSGIPMGLLLGLTYP
jgi:hypothetical protein